MILCLKKKKSHWLPQKDIRIQLILKTGKEEESSIYPAFPIKN